MLFVHININYEPAIFVDKIMGSMKKTKFVAQKISSHKLVTGMYLQESVLVCSS